MEINLFSRPLGVICYEANLFGDIGTVDQVPAQLLSTGLTWYWSSFRPRPLPDDSEFKDRIAERRLTLLAKENAIEFSDDFRERDEDGYGRSIHLVGAESDQSCELENRSRLSQALKSFLEQEEGPIRVVIIQVGDSPEYVFVPHKLTPPLSRLLEGWGIVPSNTASTRPYEQLNLATLESRTTAILDLALGTD